MRKSALLLSSILSAINPSVDAKDLIYSQTKSYGYLPIRNAANFAPRVVMQRIRLYVVENQFVTGNFQVQGETFYDEPIMFARCVRATLRAHNGKVKTWNSVRCAGENIVHDAHYVLFTGSWADKMPFNGEITYDLVGYAANTNINSGSIAYKYSTMSVVTE